MAPPLLLLPSSPPFLQKPSPTHSDQKDTHSRVSRSSSLLQSLLNLAEVTRVELSEDGRLSRGWSDGDSNLSEMSDEPVKGKRKREEEVGVSWGYERTKSKGREDETRENSEGLDSLCHEPFNLCLHHPSIERDDSPRSECLSRLEEFLRNGEGKRGDDQLSVLILANEASRIERVEKSRARVKEEGRATNLSHQVPRSIVGVDGLVVPVADCFVENEKRVSDSFVPLLASFTSFSSPTVVSSLES